MQNVNKIRYKKTRKQIPSGIPLGKSVCVTTYPDTLENDIKKYLNLGYLVITVINDRLNTKVYMEKTT